MPPTETYEVSLPSERLNERRWEAIYVHSMCLSGQSLLDFFPQDKWPQSQLALRKLSRDVEPNIRIDEPLSDRDLSCDQWRQGFSNVCFVTACNQNPNLRQVPGCYALEEF